MLSIAILAAGKGTRMASSIPKVLHQLSGKTLLQRVIDSCKKLKPDKIFIIVGHKSKVVEDEFTLQKLVNRSMHLYINDDDFKQQIQTCKNLIPSGSRL